MTLHSAILVAALIALLGASGLGAAGVLARRRALLDLGYAGTLLSGVLLAAALIQRAVASGHAPWSNLRETAVAFAFGALLVFVLMEGRLAIRALVPVLGIVAAGLVWLALAQPDDVRPLVPALQAPLLLTLHVGSALLAYAIGAVAFAAALTEIVQRRASNGLGLLPEAATARVAAHRAVLLGFPILTAAIVLGSVWANLAWRSYWSNDPKELAAAATWLVYGGYLHVAGRRDRWSRVAPWLLVLGFAGVLFTYLGAGLVFVGEHSYAGA